MQLLPARELLAAVAGALRANHVLRLLDLVSRLEDWFGQGESAVSESEMCDRLIRRKAQVLSRL